MASLNLCQFIGRIGKIETRYLSNGDAVTNCSIAVNETWKDQNGEKQERCEWVNITAYKKLAEIMQSYCVNGMQIYVSGKMQTRKYTDKNGVERYATEIIAIDMKMLGGKSASSNDDLVQSKQDETKSYRGEVLGAKNNTGFDDMSDDIPW